MSPITKILKYWVSSPVVHSQTVQLWKTKYSPDIHVSLFFPVTMEGFLLYDVNIPFSPILNVKLVKATQATTAWVEG